MTVNESRFGEHLVVLVSPDGDVFAGSQFCCYPVDEPPVIEFDGITRSRAFLRGQGWTIYPVEDLIAVDSGTRHPRFTECLTCGRPGEFFDSPTGSWWSHFDHPGDEHEFEPPTTVGEIAAGRKAQS